MRGAIRRASRLGQAPGGTVGRPVILLPRVPYYSAPEVGKRLIRRYVTVQCARARATSYPTASGTLRGAHGVASVASFVDILAKIFRAPGALLRGSPSALSGAADQLFVKTTPDGIRYQMDYCLEELGRPQSPAPVTTGGGGSSTRAPYAEETSAAGLQYYCGGYSYSSGVSAAAEPAQWSGGYLSAEAGPSRATRLTRGPDPTGRGPSHESPFDRPPRAQYGGYARRDTPSSPDLG